MFSLWEEQSFPLVWFERVASHSNIADVPSRLDMSLLDLHAGYEVIEISLHSLLEETLSQIPAG